MDPEQVARLEAEAEELAMRIGDLHSLALLRMLASARPGLEQTTSEWIEGVEEANRLAEESADRHLRAAIRGAGAYAYLCAADFEQLDREADEVLELAAGDPGTGAGIIVGCPLAWALGIKAIVCRERTEFEECERFLSEALLIAEEQGDLETTSWNRGTQALLHAARGDAAAGVAIGRRNVETTERLGDVFSRSLALGNLGGAQLGAEDFAGALASFEEAERLHEEGMGGGDEMEAWRAAIRAEALLGLDRTAEALEIAERATNIARRRELLWSLPMALRTLGVARARVGVEGAEEALQEASEIARRTGALLSLEAIEESRAEPTADARQPTHPRLVGSDQVISRTNRAGRKATYSRISHTAICRVKQIFRGVVVVVMRRSIQKS